MQQSREEHAVRLAESQTKLQSEREKFAGEGAKFQRDMEVKDIKAKEANVKLKKAEQDLAQSTRKPKKVKGRFSDGEEILLEEVE